MTTFAFLAVTNTGAARITAKLSSVNRIRSSILHTEGPSSPDCKPKKVPQGKCLTTKAANERRADFHDMKSRWVVYIAALLPALQLKTDTLMLAPAFLKTSDEPTRWPAPPPTTTATPPSSSPT